MASLELLQGPAAAQPPGSNRRVAVRHQCRSGTAGRVAIPGALVVRGTLLRDLSVSGLALRLGRSLRRGTRLLIQLRSPVLGLSYDLSACVVHCTQQAAGKWLVGCAFARELTQQELQTLL